MKQEHRPRDETMGLILDAVAHSESGLTRTQIADAIDRTKTPHLIKMVESLVDDGYLVRQIKLFGNGVEGYIYTIHDAYKDA